MLNPSLVKRGIDDEEYSNACPTIGTLMVAHFSTPERHRADIYGADGLFFATHHERRTYLRPAFLNEYDISERETQNAERPMLWVLVSQLADGHHMILPAWRGKAFWNGPESDSDQAVAVILLQTCLRGGINIAEWMSYVYDQRARKANNKAMKAKGPVIH
jgi:hypothetical protein